MFLLGLGNLPWRPAMSKIRMINLSLHQLDVVRGKKHWGLRTRRKRGLSDIMKKMIYLHLGLKLCQVWVKFSDMFVHHLISVDSNVHLVIRDLFGLLEHPLELRNVKILNLLWEEFRIKYFWERKVEECF